MKLIKKIQLNNAPNQIRFYQENNYYNFFERNIFLYSYTNQNNQVKWNWKNEYKYIKDWLKDKAKEDYPLYVLLNEQNRVIDMIPVKLPTYLIDFYKHNRYGYENYALAVEKFGHFRKDKLEYTHPDTKKGLFYPSNFKKELIDSIKEKQEKIIENLRTGNKTVICNELTQTWRMATGLGNASTYNNGFTFHPVFGIPYLGGQQIKGIVRAYLIRKHFYIEEEDGKEVKGKDIEKKAMKDELFAYLFGREKVDKDETERKGNLLFLDAFPTNNALKMKADIMNPHYGKYYSDKEPPGDYLKPNPIFFLSVEKGTFNFCFWIEKEKDVEIENFNDSKLKEGFEDNNSITQFIKTILPEALQELGIGAKTAVGYGRFKKQISINHENKKQ